MAYDYKRQIAGLLDYAESKTKKLKECYLMYKSIHSESVSRYRENGCMTLEKIALNTSGSSWDAIMIVDIMEHEMNFIKCIHKSEMASNYNVYIIDESLDNSEEMMDQYDFMVMLENMVKKEKEGNK